MQTKKFCGWLGQGLALLTLAAALAGCGGGSSSSGASSTSKISGTPPATVVANNHYSFTPTVENPTGEPVSFSIQNKPGWASFDLTSGGLSGNPTAANAGRYDNIIISVTFHSVTAQPSPNGTAADTAKNDRMILSASDGTTTIALPAFSIVVSGASASASSSSSSGSSSSGSSSSSSSGSSVPPAAAAVGYNTVTFGPNPTLGTNLFPWEFLGPATQPAGYAAQNANGSLAIPGPENNHDGASVSGVQKISGGHGWSGLAFGGGAYFEAVLSFTGQTDYYYPNGGPVFWLMDIEQFSQAPYSVGWPSGSTPAWSASTSYAAGDMVGYNGQIWLSINSGNVNNPPPSSGSGANAYWTGYNDFFEIDVMQYDSANAKFPDTYQVEFANWYGSPTTGSGPSKNWPEAVPGAVGSISVPSGTDFSKPHKYGFLWVPATGSGQTTFTQGYAKAYLDGVQVGQTGYWNYYDMNQPGNYPAPPPVIGTTCLSGMDWRHLVPILGTEPQHPMTVYSLTVWQASGANNLTE
jgi:hypothetical protein